MESPNLSPEIINVFTDGSLMRRGKTVLCGYGIYFPAGEYKPISKKFTKEPITNNRAELYAIYKAILITNVIAARRLDSNDIPVLTLNIYSDSEYSVKTFNTWLPKWLKSGKDYMNKDIIDKVWTLLSKADYDINFIHIRAHTNKSDPESIANHIVDDLAKKGAIST